MTAALSGLLLGSFLNVCIARLPQHRSIAWPGSHCPRCAAPIRPWDNVPLLSFVLLRGRCRACRQPITLRYPFVEAALALLFVLVAARFTAPYAMVEAATLCFLLLGLLIMDAETFRLPDSFTLPGIVLGLLASLLPGGGLIAELKLGSSAPFQVTQWPALLSGLAASVGAAAILLLIRWLYRLARRREGMGLGDVKLASLLGAWFGIAGVALTLVVAVLLAACAGLLLQRRRREGPLRLPFGSFLCGAGLITLLYGRELLTWYFSFWP